MKDGQIPRMKRLTVVRAVAAFILSLQRAFLVLRLIAMVTISLGSNVGLCCLLDLDGLFEIPQGGLTTKPGCLAISH